MDPKQKEHKENTAVNCVPKLPLKLYHKSEELALLESSLLIAIIILSISILANMIMFIRIDQLQIKIQKLEEISAIETEQVLAPEQQSFSTDPIIEKEPLYETMPICSSGATFKSWMDYRKITDKSTRQWKYQQMAKTDENGFRRFDEYYMVAMANMYGPVGTKYIITFSSGTTIYAIIGDVKANTSCQHLDSSMLEYIIQDDVISPSLKRSGNVNDIFKGTITEIRVVK